MNEKFLKNMFDVKRVRQNGAGEEINLLLEAVFKIIFKIISMNFLNYFES